MVSTRFKQAKNEVIQFAHLLRIQEMAWKVGNKSQNWQEKKKKNTKTHDQGKGEFQIYNFSKVSMWQHQRLLNQEESQHRYNKSAEQTNSLAELPHPNEKWNWRKQTTVVYYYLLLTINETKIQHRNMTYKNKQL